jgi:hypothetical protein
LQEAGSLAKTFGSKVFEDGTIGAVKGAQFVLSNYHDISLLPSGIEGGIAGKIGGSNIANAGVNAVIEVAGDKVIHQIFSNGGKTATYDPLITKMPFVPTPIKWFFLDTPIAESH